MLPELEKLLVLQDRDRKIQGLLKDLQRIPMEEAAIRSRVAAEEKAVADAKSALQANEVEIKKIELEVETCKTTLTRLRTQQFETRKNEEFRALAHEIERYEKQIGELEDRELERMEKADSLKEKLGEARAALEASSHHVNADLEKFAERRRQAEAQLESLKTERADLASKVEESTLYLYERLFKNKGGTVVVPVDNRHQSCGGCHMKITTSTLHKARAERELTHCDQCNRLLYVIDDDA